jgi:hypothetical protein
MKGFKMKDEKSFKAFKEQVEIFDILWFDDETGIALCDDGSDDDVLYLIKDKVPFEFYKLVNKEIAVKFIDCMCRQLFEKVRSEKC